MLGKLYFINQEQQQMNWDYPWMILLLEIIDKWYIMRSDTEIINI